LEPPDETNIPLEIILKVAAQKERHPFQFAEEVIYGIVLKNR